MGEAMLKFDWRHGHYLFHVHTSHTDGDLTAAQCVDFAEKAGASTVVFLEHIRRTPRYDVERFSAEVRLAGRRSVQTVLGFEAKLLPDGTLDINDDCLDIAAVVGIAEHAFPNDRALLLDTVLNVVRTYPLRWPQATFVWVHPGLWYLKHNLDAERDEAFQQMLTEAQGAGVLIEQNLRHRLPSPTVAARLPAQSVVTGADAHSLRDLERWAAQHPAGNPSENSPRNARRPQTQPHLGSGVAVV
jgi:putative hydrolase